MIEKTLAVGPHPFRGLLPQQLDPPALTFGQRQRQHFNRAPILKMQAITRVKLAAALADGIPVQSESARFDLGHHLAAGHQSLLRAIASMRQDASTVVICLGTRCGGSWS